MPMQVQNKIEFFNETVRVTIIASISSSERGVRFGRSEAFPPRAVLDGGDGTSDLNR